MTERIYTFNLPDIGEGVVEGEVIQWLKKIGDSVKKDEPVVIVMTDKATVELPAPYPGIISRHYFKPGELSIRDKPLYDITLDADVENLPLRTTQKVSICRPEPSSKQTAAQVASSGKALAKPKVRHFAKEMGIDIATITPSGNQGDVTLHDLHHVRKKVALNTFEGDEDHPLIGIKGLMARKMDGVHVPQFSYFEQVDATRLVLLREKLKEAAFKEGLKLSYMPFLIRALVLVIKEFPYLNSAVDMERNAIICHKQINVGTAIATPHGLIVPVLKGVQEMNLNQITHAFEALKERAQAGKLTNADMHGATITLSNFGAVGEGRWATPMVSPPEVAILAVARIAKTPVVRNDEVVVRDILNLSWSFDHRVIDGELAAKISGKMSKHLKDPAVLID